ncbi:MAG TPA: GNAT family N-acetyltransferase, partial [Actinospica sp.]|nr:GNAT family N-acetyltransferase [Actinospica sp.]
MTTQDPAAAHRPAAGSAVAAVAAVAAAADAADAAGSAGADFTSVSLRTDRLLLRPWGEQDIDAITAACQDPEIQRYVPLPAPYTRAHAETFVRETAPKGRAAGTDVVFGAIARETGAPVASVGLHRIKALGAEYGGVGEIGFWTAPGARGRGYMTEAVREVCRWGFEELGLARIEWIAVADNEASWRVVQKLGFTL